MTRIECEWNGAVTYAGTLHLSTEEDYMSYFDRFSTEAHEKNMTKTYHTGFECNHNELNVLKCYNNLSGYMMLVEGEVLVTDQDTLIIHKNRSLHGPVDMIMKPYTPQ